MIDNSKNPYQPPTSKPVDIGITGLVYPKWRVIIQSMIVGSLINTTIVSGITFLLYSLSAEAFDSFSPFNKLWQMILIIALVSAFFGAIQGLLSGIIFSLLKFKLTSSKSFLKAGAITSITASLLAWSLGVFIGFEQITFVFIAFWAMLGFFNIIFIGFILPTTNSTHTDNAP